jgi:hypothetical protein
MASTTRRAILGAIACTPVLAVSCAPQPAAAKALGNWHALHARYLALVSECEAFTRDHYDPVWEKHDLICGPEPRLEYSITGPSGHTVTFPLRGPDFVCQPFDNHQREAARVVGAWKDWRARVGESERQLGIAAIADEYDRQWDQIWATEDELLAMPASDLPALRWKLEKLRERSDERSTEPQGFDVVIADVRRLEGEE